MSANVKAVQYKTRRELATAAPLTETGLGRRRRPPGAAKRALALVVACGLIAAGCGSDSGADAEDVSSSNPTAPKVDSSAATSPTTATPLPGLNITIPSWLYTRTLATDSSGFAASQPTPPELTDRKLPPRDVLPLPTTYEYKASINPLAGEPLTSSTWHEGCPVPKEELRYVTVTYWGFDERPHVGELILHQDVAIDIVAIFQQIYDARFPIEEMRIVHPDELLALPTGDGNNSASYVCRAVTSGTKFSQHAYGLAIDINPFHNPYTKNGLVLPELSTAYLDRTQDLDGMLDSEAVAVRAFLELGWGWGGNWNTLKDYQHFSQNGR